ncbi:MAG TPA: ABC transporter substrate-binding protein, partial [Dehalococcoidia bacterium]|nr:ABC transporter substrate-binding protein [Dehalococcoidia bacterium]
MEQRISRRRALAGLAVSAGGAMLAAACGRSGSGAPAAATPHTGGTLRVATALPVEYGLDPHVERGAGLAIFPRVYGYTHHVDFENDDAIVLDQAASVEQPDALTTLIRLRPGVRFQDIAPVSGRAVTAHDVVASVLRYRDHQLVTDKLWHTSVLDRIEAADDTTVRVLTRRPYVYSLQQLGDVSAGAIIPRELVDANADLRMSGVGSGPFSIDHADPDARVWRLARNGAYFRAPLPYLDGMEWRVYDDDDAKLAAFATGKADQVDNRDRPESITTGAGAAHAVIDAHPSLAWLSLGLRIDHPPFNDARFRHALDVAIDRDALIRGLAPDDGMVLGPVNQHLARGFWSLPESEVRAAFAVPGSGEVIRTDAARQLLSAAGAGSASFTIQTVNTPRMIDVASAIRQQLLAVGLDVRIDELDEVTWFANFRKGAFEATVISHAPYETPDMPSRLYHSSGVDGTANQFGLHDSNIDMLIERSWG